MGARCEEPGHVVVVVVVKCERLWTRKAVEAQTKMAQETLYLPQDAWVKEPVLVVSFSVWGLNIIMPIVSLYSNMPP